MYTFKPTAKNHVGQFPVKGILSNQYNSLNFEFNLRVANDPPFLKGVPKDEYILPEAVSTITLGDPDDLERLKVKLSTFEKDKKTLPGFISYVPATKTYTIAPTIFDKVGKYAIIIKLTDEFGAENHYQFSVIVY